MWIISEILNLKREEEKRKKKGLIHMLKNKHKIKNTLFSINFLVLKYYLVFT